MNGIKIITQDSPIAMIKNIKTGKYWPETKLVSAKLIDELFMIFSNFIDKNLIRNIDLLKIEIYDFKINSNFYFLFHEYKYLYGIGYAF